jgi:hypothetical protein
MLFGSHSLIITVRPLIITLCNALQLTVYPLVKHLYIPTSVQPTNNSTYTKKLAPKMNRICPFNGNIKVGKTDFVHFLS